MESFSSVVLCSIDMVDDHFSKAKDLMRSASDTKKQFSASTELGPLPPPRHEYSWSDPLEMASPTRRESPGPVAEEQAPWPPTFPSEVHGSALHSNTRKGTSADELHEPIDLATDVGESLLPKQQQQNPKEPLFDFVTDKVNRYIIRKRNSS